MRLLTSVLAGSTLAVGFGVAQATGNRPLGGAVLLAGAATCGVLWWRQAGAVPTLVSEAVFAAAFIGSHPLAKQIGAWPSVAVVAGATAVISYAITAAPDRT
ncbi:MAG: hypothetical protein PHU75_05540 [Candidatus Nanopelagicales bacterium]|nr:hypothetical protein [Candidatus Nanopelagicales bacterium]